MSSTIRTGNMGDNIRNEIAWRDEWVKILDDTKKFLREKEIIVAEVRYDSSIRQDQIDYERRTVTLSFRVSIQTLSIPSNYIKIINDVNEGLNATGRKSVWKIDNISLSKILGSIGHQGYIGAILVSGTLVNSNGKRIGAFNNRRLSEVYFNDAGDVFLDYKNHSFEIIGDSSRTSRNWRINIYGVPAADITDQMTIQFYLEESGYNLKFRVVD